MKYYYPLFSYDFTFENIFSTESVSPYSFYPKREFGIQYFYKIPLIHLDDFLVLFSAPPSFDVQSKNIDGVKFILEIDSSAVKGDELEIIDEGIFAYPKTIYFKKNNFNVLFFSERDKKYVSLRAETSLPTKSLKRFEENLKVISESVCRSFNIEQISLIELYNLEIDKHIHFDRVFNFLKGLFYGLVAGFGISENQPSIKKRFQEITDGFAELKSKCEELSDYMNIRIHSSYKNRTQDFAGTERFEDRLKQHLLTLQHELGDIFGNDTKINDNDIIEFLIKEFPIQLGSRDKALEYYHRKQVDDILFGTKNSRILKELLLKKSNTLDANDSIELLQEYIGEYVNACKKPSKWSSTQKERINDSFKSTLYSLEKSAEKELLKKAPTNSFNFNQIKIDLIKNNVSFGENIALLNTKDIDEFRLVCNAILHNPRLGSGEIKKASLLKIIETIGDEKSSIGGRNTALYKYINNEVHEFTDKTQTVVMKNFIAFIFNADSLEKLEKYINAKQVESNYMAYAFWCSFNGFANISKNFLKTMYAVDSSEDLDKIEIILEEIRQQNIEIGFKYVNNLTSYKPPHIAIARPNIDKLVDENKLINFYFKHIYNKYPIIQDNAINILSNYTGEVALDKFKEHGIGKRDGKRIMKLFAEYIALLF